MNHLSPRRNRAHESGHKEAELGGYFPARSRAEAAGKAAEALQQTNPRQKLAAPVTEVSPAQQEVYHSSGGERKAQR